TPTVHERRQPDRAFPVDHRGSIFISDLGVSTNGQGLEVTGDTQASLVLRFDVPARRLSVPFGNVCCGLVDKATLRVYADGHLVAKKSKAGDGTDDLHQAITYEGSPITR